MGMTKIDGRLSPCTLYERDEEDDFGIETPLNGGARETWQPHFVSPRKSSSVSFLSILLG